MHICDECGEEFDDSELDYAASVDDEQTICAWCNSEEACNGQFED